MIAYMITKKWHNKIVRSSVEVFTDIDDAADRYKELAVRKFSKHQTRPKGMPWRQWAPIEPNPSRPKGTPRKEWKKYLESRKRDKSWKVYLLQTDRSSKSGTSNMKAATDKWIRKNLLGEQ